MLDRHVSLRPICPGWFWLVQPYEWAGVFISFDLNREQNFVEPIQRSRRQWLGYYNFLGNGCRLSVQNINKDAASHSPGRSDSVLEVRTSKINPGSLLGNQGRGKQEKHPLSLLILLTQYIKAWQVFYVVWVQIPPLAYESEWRNRQTRVVQAHVFASSTLAENTKVVDMDSH